MQTQEVKRWLPAPVVAEFAGHDWHDVDAVEMVYVFAGQFPHEAEPDAAL